MVYVRSRTFCCCIPVRAGVFILSLLGVLGGGLVSVAAWVQVNQLRTYSASQSDVVAFWLNASIFTLLTLMSIFGFIGCLVKSRNSVNAYGWGLLSFIVMSIITGAYSLWAIFNKPPSQDDYLTCLNGTRSDNGQITCGNATPLYKGLMVGLYIFTWLFMIYAYVIVDNYVDQLDEEIHVHDTQNMIQSIGQPQVTVQPVTVPAYASFGPTAQRSATGYAFAHQNQSYGSRPNASMV